VSRNLDLDNVQGNILRGYRGGLGCVRHLLLEVTDRALARRFLARSAAGDAPDVPAITRATRWAETPNSTFNIGLTFAGLRALGLSQDMLDSFPTEFREGMARRALKLGDFGHSAPAKWAPPFDQPERIHVIASVYATEWGLIGAIADQVAKAFTVLGARDGSARVDANVLGPAYAKDGSQNNRVFFGYADSISQPRFKIAGYPDPQYAVPDAPLGMALLGYETALEGLLFKVPMSDDLGADGSFNAFRVLAQDTAGFENWLDETARLIMTLEATEGPQLLKAGGEKEIAKNLHHDLDRFGALREVIAAQMLGRWRNGTPLDTRPDAPLPEEDLTPKILNDFDYTDEIGPDGTIRISACPAGAHIRRVAPRNGQIVQRAANYTRRLIRRGMPYGPDFDASSRDTQERGLLGNFIGASLGAQFEAVMCDWLNLGLHDPDITGAHDPLIGANSAETSWFDLRLLDGTPHRVRGFPRFVTTRGGAYTFLPSLAAISYLGSLQG
jgi:deferrochelatase/peroxidase EfeB